MRQLGAGSRSGKREKQENGTDGNGKKKKIKKRGRLLKVREIE